MLAIVLASAPRQAEGASPHLADTLTSALTISQIVRDVGKSLGTAIRAHQQLWLKETALPLKGREQPKDTSSTPSLHFPCCLP